MKLLTPLGEDSSRPLKPHEPIRWHVGGEREGSYPQASPPSRGENVRQRGENVIIPWLG
ncbi:MAG: hypothetical protein JWP57_4602, partial [Spirosoma sp.]|nr:hypothetical protein [Spirosoma sp.]